MAGRRGNVYYLGLVAFVTLAAWVCLQLFGTGPGRPFRDSDLVALFAEIDLPAIKIDLKELPLGFALPSRGYQPMPRRVLYADEMEVALVQNRNRLLRTSTRIASNPID